MKLMNTPKSLELSVTHRCNLRCSYCSHFSGPGDVDHDLSTEEWLKFFEELGRCAVMNVTIQGGEAFIRKDLKELIAGIVRNRMRFSILSNGTLINDDIAAYIAGTGRCSHIQVSIDGSGPETHDACRGDGNFAKAVQGLEILRKYNIPVAVRTTIHRHNLNDLDNIAEFLLEKLRLPGFSTNSASYMGLCREHAENVQLTAEDRSSAMATLLRLNRKYDNRISAAAGPLAEAKMWMKMEEARREGQKSLPPCGYLTSCGCMWSKIDIRADGVMIPCTQMSHIELGRINSDDLKSVWQNHPELKLMRERPNIPLEEFEFCKGCEYIPYCRGGCPALAYTLMGKETHPSPDSCLKRFLEQGGKLPDVL